MSSQDVIIRLRAAGQAQFTGAMDKAAGSVEKVGTETEGTEKKVKKSTGRISGAWSGMAKGMAATGAAIAAQKFLRDSVGGAVDLNEEINKTGVVFRANGAALVKWSASSAKALGMSREQALAAAGTFGNMLVPMGFARGRAAGMSKNMVKLAADMASFNNATPEDTLDALRSGLAGETEPLRRFGVFLSEARIKAQALSMGLVKGAKDTHAIKAAQLTAEVTQRKYNQAVKEHGKNSNQAKMALAAQQRAESSLGKAMAGKLPQLTATQKAQASYALMLKDTKDAQGDFQRTSGSLANQQRILKAQYTNIAATLGKNLLPVLTKGAQVLSFLATNMTVVLAVLAPLTIAFIAYKVAALAATLATLGLNAAWLLVPLAIAALIVGLVVAYKKVAWFRSAVNAMGNALKAVWLWVKANWKMIALFLANPLAAAVVLIAKHWSAIKRGAGRLLDWFKGLGKRLVTAMASGITAMPGVILDALKSLLPGGKIGRKLAGLVIPGHAFGGLQAHTGAAIVGERGPELVQLPGGTRVTPLSAGGTALAPAIAGGGSLGRPQTTAHFYLDRRLIATAVADDTADRKARR